MLQAKEGSRRRRTCPWWLDPGPGIDGNAAKRDAIARSILTHLTRLNSEFANYAPAEYGCLASR